MRIESTDNKIYQLFYCYSIQNYEQCLILCDELLAKNPIDQTIWFIKIRVLTEMSYLDDTEYNANDIIFDERVLNTDFIPRPGTTATGKTPRSGGGRTPLTGNRIVHTSGAATLPSTPGFNQSVRPSSSKGQFLPGFFRVANYKDITSFIRLGTESLADDGVNQLIDTEKLDLKKVSSEKISRALFLYIYYFENKYHKALELAAHATVSHDYKDWWWKVQLGKCYYKLGLFLDAIKQFESALKLESTENTYLYLSKTFLKLQKNNDAIQCIERGLEKHNDSIDLLLALARIYETQGDLDHSVEYFRKVLYIDNSNKEALASLASNSFYKDQPEVALRYYKRLLQMGFYDNAEIWNNIGLCTFYSQQYDMCLVCFERALQIAENDITVSDIWYNLSQVANSIGDIPLTYRCLKLAIASNPSHYEAWNNLGVLEALSYNNKESAKTHFNVSTKGTDYLYEPFFNSAILNMSEGNIQESYNQCKKSLEIFPEFNRGKELMKTLENHLSII
ncbi:tetratricopeptide repeat protein 8-like protein [Neocallimastix californiae]|uniref:Tetratricopeptide repeat protein 8-like protein n=1 Tax=Neocallimastix californiae TaxID=1754190 RepID=A0A1Y2FE34_9FUNG|nr:tetratricopeptide repeat protein 8-like protein [Neocallimastix californiae]|eukprot:ORY82179.1 tetratricopeptide repeat protein 8-like protein [Neocallimastix californiae]